MSMTRVESGARNKYIYAIIGDVGAKDRKPGEVSISICWIKYPG